MNVYDYVAIRNMATANNLLATYGLNKTDDYVLVSDRLKAIVRRDKESALKKIANIHPDKDLIFQFDSPVEEEFLNITGRTPEFINNSSPILENQSPILDNQMQPPPPPPPITPPPVQNNEEVKRAIDELKKENKNEREKIKIEKRNRQKMAQLGNTGLLMCVVAFAIGYMIGNKK